LQLLAGVRQRRVDLRSAFDQPLGDLKRLPRLVSALRHLIGPLGFSEPPVSLVNGAADIFDRKACGGGSCVELLEILERLGVAGVGVEGKTPTLGL
jgi:hypothetical protein